MTFPLPEGTCRIVCRPKRSEPRYVKARDVIRMAKAAVIHGVEPCSLVDAVAVAVGCVAGDCSREAIAARAVVDIVEATREDYRAALSDLLYALTGAPLRGANVGQVLKWLVKNASAIYSLWSALWDVLDVGTELERNVSVLERAVSRLADCAQAK